MPLILADEDGPVEKIPETRFPVSRGNRHMFEDLAAPVSRDLDQFADNISASTGPIHGLGARDINADFARTMPGAVNEIGVLLNDESDVDPGRMLADALEGVNEAFGLEQEKVSSAQIGESADVPLPNVPFDAVEYQLAGGDTDHHDDEPI